MKMPSMKRSAKRNMDKTSKTSVASNSNKPGFFDRLFGFLGRAMIVFGKAICIGLLDVGIVFLIACVGVPVSIVSVSTMLGMGVENTLLDLIFVFGAPCLFILIMWVVFAVWFLKFVNNYIRKLFKKISIIGGMNKSK